MAIGLFLVVGLIFVLIAASATWLVIEIFRKRDEKKYKGFILNFMNNIHSGGFFGYITERTRGKGNRHLVKYEAKDKKLKKGIKLEDDNVIVDHNKLISFPAGILSPEENIFIALPPHATDFDENFKKTAIGAALAWATELQNLADLEVKILTEGGVRKDALLKNIGSGEISKEFQAFQEQLVKDVLSATIRARDDKGKNITSPGPGGLSIHQD